MPGIGSLIREIAVEISDMWESKHNCGSVKPMPVVRVKTKIGIPVPCEMRDTLNRNDCHNQLTFLPLLDFQMGLDTYYHLIILRAYHFMLSSHTLPTYSLCPWGNRIIFTLKDLTPFLCNSNALLHNFRHPLVLLVSYYFYLGLEYDRNSVKL